MIKRSNFYSELRQDPISQEWVIVAKHRLKRPGGKITGKKRKHQPISQCPFENPQATGHGDPLFKISKKLNGDWSVQVVNNKFPSLITGQKGQVKVGPYLVLNAIGHCEVVLTRPHTKSLAQLPLQTVEEMFLAYLVRANELAKDKNTKYVMGFINFGPSAGASISHPHGQIISLPIVPPDIILALKRVKNYYQKNKSCVYCDIIKWEKKEKKRLVFENEKFLTVTPFISKNAYELIIYPKTHAAQYRKIDLSDLKFLAEALIDALKRLDKELQDPDYNLYIKTAPVDNKGNYFHWYIDIIPKTELAAGFELGTGMEICALDPEEAARRLRKYKFKIKQK